MAQKTRVDISIFDGGLNYKADFDKVPQNQTPYAANIVFDDYGSFSNRAGHKTHNSTPMVSGQPIDGMMSYQPAVLSSQMLAVCGGSVYKATGAGTAFAVIASSQSVFTYRRACEIVAFQDLAFFSNGDTQPYKFNGTEFTRAGVSAPSQVLTGVSDAGGGNLTGTYQYVFWGVNSYSAEGDYGTASTAVTVTTAKVRVNNIPTAPVSHGINTWKVGRNTAGATGEYWYLTDITNGTTSFTDNVADSSLTVLAPTDQGYPRYFLFMVPYAGRLWGAVDDILWFSNENQPEEFPSTNFIRVGRGDGMSISSIAPFKGMIVVSKSDFRGKTALYTLTIGDSVTFSDPQSWYLELVANYGGSEAQRATIPFSDYLLLFNRHGAFAFNGGSIEKSVSVAPLGSLVADSLSEVIELGRTASNPTFLKAAAAVDWKRKIWISLDESAADTYPTNGLTYQYDYSTISRNNRRDGAWTKFTLNVASQFVVHEHKLFAGNPGGLLDANGYIYELDTGAADRANGTGSYLCEYYSPILAGQKGHEELHKDFRFLYITAKGSGTITVKYNVDAISQANFDITATSVSLTLSATGSRHKIDLVGMSGKWLNVYVSKTLLGNSFAVSKIEAFYNVRGLRN